MMNLEDLVKIVVGSLTPQEVEEITLLGEMTARARTESEIRDVLEVAREVKPLVNALAGRYARVLENRNLEKGPGR